MNGKNTLVLDLTYYCNATCRYCRWGNPKTSGREHLPLDTLLIPSSSLKRLGIERLVLSGGEPRLHPNFGDIIAYYRHQVDEIVPITNGYALNFNSVSLLIEQGITGITFSMDSIVPEEEFATRNTPAPILGKIISTLRDLSAQDLNLEVGINSVVSHANSKWNSVELLLNFAEELGLDFVKFQPIFDDGYVLCNSPELMLSGIDAQNLAEIAERIPTHSYGLTNNADFWLDLSDIVNGKKLDGVNCGLGPHKTNAVQGNLTMCYWLEMGNYGSTISPLKDENIRETQKNFRAATSECDIDFHCFCNQKVGHAWR